MFLITIFKWDLNVNQESLKGSTHKPRITREYEKKLFLIRVLYGWSPLQTQIVLPYFRKKNCYQIFPDRFASCRLLFVFGVCVCVHLIRVCVQRTPPLFPTHPFETSAQIIINMYFFRWFSSERESSRSFSRMQHHKVQFIEHDPVWLCPRRNWTILQSGEATLKLGI